MRMTSGGAATPVSIPVSTNLRTTEWRFSGAWLSRDSVCVVSIRSPAIQYDIRRLTRVDLPDFFNCRVKSRFHKLIADQSHPVFNVFRTAPIREMI